MKKISLAFVFAVLFVSCGDENSKKNPIEPDTEIGMSSSMKDSSSSMKQGESSSSTKKSSSSVKQEESSSSTKKSSSSVKQGESSSSMKESSSCEKSEDSSSSEESSSSLNPIESSSSENSSSSEIISSSSDLTIGICKTRTVDNCAYGTLYDDRDGQTYKTIKIGNQEWMAENLNFVAENIQNSSQKSYCPMDLDSCAKYGRYYTWTSAIDSVSIDTLYSIKCGHGAKKCNLDTIVVRGVCPKGWHIPSNSEWNDLINFVGNTKAGKMLKSTSDWMNWNGEDSFGFTVLGTGSFDNGFISDKGEKASLWIASDATQQTAKCADFNYSELKKDEILIQSNYKESATALPVRCIKD